MLQLPSYIIIKNNNNKKKETYIVHIPYKYVHIGITNYENMISLIIFSYHIFILIKNDKLARIYKEKIKNV